MTNAPPPVSLIAGVLTRRNNHWELSSAPPPESRPPPPLRNVNFSITIGGSVSWNDWVILKDSWSPFSFLRWIWSGGMVTEDEYRRTLHWGYDASHDCHIYGGVTYCYHRDPHVHPEFRNVPTNAPIAKEGRALTRP